MRRPLPTPATSTTCTTNLTSTLYTNVLGVDVCIHFSDVCTRVDGNLEMHTQAVHLTSETCVTLVQREVQPEATDWFFVVTEARGDNGAEQPIAFNQLKELSAHAETLKHLYVANFHPERVLDELDDQGIAYQFSP